MTVYERVQALGEWDIQLSEGVPKSIRDLIVPYSHVVIYPGRVYADRLADASILAGALYTGVVIRPPGRGLTVGGSGLAYWLGDSDNKGTLLEAPATSATPQGIIPWALALIPPELLSTGTISDPGGTLAGSYQWVTPRQALDGVCAALGVEWRVNPDFEVDVRTVAQLYGSTPVAIAMQAGGGSDDTYAGLDAKIVVNYDYSDYASRVILSAQDGRYASGGLSPYRDGQGNLTYRYRVVDSPDTQPGGGTAAAAALVNIWSAATSQQDLAVTVRRFAITRLVKAGQRVYVYDPEFGLLNTANVVRHQGRGTFPLSVRVLGVRWPIAAPMSVLLRYYSGGSFLYADLSDYVEYESGDSTLEV